ncbi:MAG: mechanosensitive ion channel domain-containing protein [Nitrospiraceae bacterium]
MSAMRPLIRPIIIALLLVVCPLIAQGQVPPQIPELVNGSATPSPTEAPVGGQTSSDERVMDLRKRLAAADAELKAVSAPDTRGKDAQPGTLEAELAERRFLLQQLVRAYEQHIGATVDLQQTRVRRQEIARRSGEWKGFDNPPPYSILMVDELRDSVDSMRRTVETLESKLTLFGRSDERARTLLKESEQRARQASEQLEEARDQAESARLGWANALAQLRQRVAAANTAMLDMSMELIEGNLAVARERLALAERQLQVAHKDDEFSESDLQKVRRRLDTERHTLEGTLERKLAEQREHAGRLDAVEAQLRELQARQARTGSKAGKTATAQLGKLTETVELRRLESENLNLQLDIFRQLVDVVERERRLWETRFTVAHSDDPMPAREAYTRLTPMIEIAKAWRAYMRQQIETVSGQIGEQENRLKNAAAGADTQILHDILEAYRDREGIYRRALERADRFSRVLDRWKSEIEQQRHALPVSARLQEWTGAAWVTIERVWRVELFAAEDTIEVDGRQITGRRSITVGKIVQAIGIFLIGYWMSLFLSRMAYRQAVGRLGMDPKLANILRQWTLAFLFTMLLVTSLLYVKIPLTVFAFLGGALAIGVGFGTQNLLKNFISGLLLLIERPLRVGDLIQVDSVRGTVVSIGFRSSTIRDGNGMELHIPNSNLLEQNLSNWTYSSQNMRFPLRVGVAYGSPSKRVRDLLAEAASQHGLVLKDPEPLALFEDFGENALVFVLYYWVDMRSGPGAAMVGSDLRFMIEKSFADEGIVLAFQQRDVHLNAGRPLRVQVLPMDQRPEPAQEVGRSPENQRSE